MVDLQNPIFFIKTDCLYTSSYRLPIASQQGMTLHAHFHPLPVAVYLAPLFPLKFYTSAFWISWRKNKWFFLFQNPSEFLFSYITMIGPLPPVNNYPWALSLSSHCDKTPEKHGKRRKHTYHCGVKKSLGTLWSFCDVPVGHSTSWQLYWTWFSKRTELIQWIYTYRYTHTHAQACTYTHIHMCMCFVWYQTQWS